MNLDNWEKVSDVDNMQFYFTLKEQRCTEMEICMPHSGNDYHYLVRIQIDIKDFDKWDNCDYEFMFQTWDDVIELVDNNYTLFLKENKE